MQKEEEEASSSSTMDPWSIFLYGMKAPMTSEKYRGRLAKFFDFIGLTGGGQFNANKNDIASGN
jgi:hypothetical protein